MDAQQDAQQEEMRYLHHILQVVQQWLHELPPDGTTLAVTTMAGEATLAHHYVERWEDLHAAQHEPYFGRVDFQPATATTQPIYIGKTGVRAPASQAILVHDWRAPVSSLFYIRGFQQVSYTAPKGLVTGDVTLRRRFHIANGELRRFSDERPSAAVTLTTSDADDYLLDLLAETRGDGLRDIIATIQAEQHDLIRAPLAGIVLIQGVAGSGKTSIMLHRLSFLLYTYPEQMHPEQTLVLGPNPLFLASIAPLFPQLGISAMRQMTFDGWTRLVLGEAAPHHVAPSGEPLVSGGDDHHGAVARAQRRRLLGSARMVELLKAAMVLRQAERLAAAPPITVAYGLPRDGEVGPSLLYTHPGTEVPVQIAIVQVQDLLRRVAQGGSQMWGVVPERQQRDHFLTACLEALWTQFSHSRAYGVPLEERIHRYRRTAFLRVVRAQLERQVQTWWPAVLPEMLITHLFGDRARLEQIVATLPSSQKSWTSTEMDLLAQVPTTAYVWTEQDLSLLCLAHLLLVGRPEQRYDYIVLDEAQDRSALDLALLRVYADHMTLVGDLAQGVFAPQGVQTWKEATSALGGGVTFHRVERSYRSTWEITHLANRVLAHGQFAQPMPPAVPLERHGPEPLIMACDTRHQMVQEAVRQALQLVVSGKRSVALIAKTGTECRQIVDLLTDEDATLIALIDSPERSLAHPVVVLPVWLAKGLEFDAVIVMGADAQAYTKREGDAKLLYVALTRALHELTVLYVGQPSALLAA